MGGMGKVMRAMSSGKISIHLLSIWKQNRHSWSFRDGFSFSVVMGPDWKPVWSVWMLLLAQQVSSEISEGTVMVQFMGSAQRFLLPFCVFLIKNFVFEEKLSASYQPNMFWAMLRSGQQAFKYWFHWRNTQFIQLEEAVQRGMKGVEDECLPSGFFSCLQLALQTRQEKKQPDKRQLLSVVSWVYAGLCCRVLMSPSFYQMCPVLHLHFSPLT